MATLPPDLQPTRKGHSVFAIGVLAFLIVALLALPFLAHAQTGSQHPSSLTVPSPRLAAMMR